MSISHSNDVFLCLLPQGAYHYDLEVSPADGLLYVAHAERRQVRASTI